MQIQCTIIFCILFCCQLSFSQSILKGTVTSDENQKPLPSVSVYLNNTSIGTITDEHGVFILKGITNGTFRLIATCVGYKTFDSLIDSRIFNKQLRISLKTNSQELEGFSVLPSDPNGWEKYGKYFKVLLIGTTPNSNDCKLMNPEVIKFRFKHR